MPLPKAAPKGTLPSIADIGAAPVTVRNRTPKSPTALPWSRSTFFSLWTSKLSCASSAAAERCVMVASRPMGQLETTAGGAGRPFLPALFEHDDLDLSPKQARA